jgi:hypothetical protein
MASLQVSGIRDLRMSFIDLIKGATGRKYDLEHSCFHPMPIDSARAIAESSVYRRKQEQCLNAFLMSSTAPLCSHITDNINHKSDDSGAETS